MIATVWVLSTMNNELVGLFDSGRIRKHFTEDFSFTTILVFIPPKNHDYSFEFHPIKTALRPQETTPVLRVVPFQDLWWHVWSSSHQIKQGATNLAPQKKEIIIILLICWDMMRDTKQKIGYDVSEVAPSQGLIHYNMFKNLHMSSSLPLCWFISMRSNHLFVSKESILSSVLYYRTVLACLWIWINLVKSINFVVQPSQNVSYSVTDRTKCPMHREGKGVCTQWNKRCVHKNALGIKKTSMFNIRGLTLVCASERSLERQTRE